MNIVEFFTTFPEMSKTGIRIFKKTVDGAYRNFSREYGDAIEAVFDPVLFFFS
jgi:glycine betaine/proline transport system permease protein